MKPLTPSHAKVLTLTFPMPENLANARMHWRVKQNAKQKFWEACDFEQFIGDLPDPPKKPIVKASIRSVMRLGAAMDDDNAMHRHKWILDWLKTRGYIQDDKRKCLKWEGFPEQIVKRNGDYSITITLTEEAA